MTVRFHTAGLTLGLLALAGCSQGESGNADASGSAQGGAPMANEATADAQSTTSQEFVEAAAASDAFEIASSRLALQKATAPEIKVYAREMITAHEASTARLRRAAAAARPAAALPADPLTREQQADLRLLGQTDGQSFDKAYVEQQAGGHEKTLAALRGYAANGTAPSLKAFAGESAPVVEAHLRMVRRLGMAPTGT